MGEKYDRQKMIETLTDPDISAILLELEDGDKQSTYLVKKLHLTDYEIRKRLSYVIQYGFIKMTHDGNKTVFTADKDKLNEIMESDDNFSGVIDGLTKMDSFLN
ncbi:MAG: hypothetical protein ACREAF_05605 [Nitrosopumilaceae archaeon]